MIISLEIRKRAKAGAGPILGILAVAYFSYHLIEGDRGLFAYLKLQHEIDRAEAVYQLTENEKQALEKRVALLRPENLDIDMLEERSRDVLGLAHPDEIVIYTK
ncbi:septum formation initiator family protein [Sneathiella sp. CAU 1612]|jgi:cell division protein FtsB|uniref:Septum formation initiator family protein n=1 Tax=Sneathiella sedimenti TaxID=2816034 RepID=A0ABS3F9G3_9PROT|nr:septum formation initiator family protein [Sneathiella sedimenti]MBO0334973.1 septum formation initiator family protein [Sneathiella sedimenti]